MKKNNIPELYKKYFIDKSDERRILFKKIAALYNPQKGLYPGSFVHITPSFFISDMTYVDSDKRISKFFNDSDVFQYVKSNQIYDEQPAIAGIQADFSSELPLEEKSFDILFSFYAGFISQSCKKYLKTNGILVCNNSHGDASIAFTDKDYDLVGVIEREGNDFSGENFIITEKDLDTYFIKKDGSPIDKAKVVKNMIGEKFTKNEYAYIFENIA